MFNQFRKSVKPCFESTERLLEFDELLFIKNDLTGLVYIVIKETVMDSVPSILCKSHQFRGMSVVRLRIIPD
ncbi:hypothetical protein B9H04_08235 [Halorubrum ezzemoulense DSM 17463]|uniref:Uncharacterized protein n=1 Tax=Halorubrum ezzemoulense DSM 17463 TaxID=1121945 RepID=A0A1X4H7T6_HALEZ|nr:hypothetical protein B9H04_08235 [Halorubrum ezzemoulense DSM 17463]